MFRILWVLALAWSIAAASAPREDSVFVYDVFRGQPACAQITSTLRSMRLRETVILSIEQGPDLILDQPGGENALRCAADALHASGHRVKTMALQDASFLDKQDDAVRRVKKIAAFARVHPKTIAGTVIDLEPYTDERWDCASPDNRAAIARRFRDLVGRLREESLPLPLEIVVPWWFAVVQEYPALHLRELGAVTDGIFLMLYGDEGGPVVSGTSARLKAKMDLVLAAGMSRTPFYIALATFEHRSSADLEREIRDLQARYGPVSQFAGTSVFHAQGRFDVSLVRMIGGAVLDNSGKGIAGARVVVLDKVAETNSCGHFTIRDLDAAGAGLSVSKPGYETTRVDVRFAEPGTLKELPPIVLR